MFLELMISRIYTCTCKERERVMELYAVALNCNIGEKGIVFRLWFASTRSKSEKFSFILATSNALINVHKPR